MKNIAILFLFGVLNFEIYAQDTNLYTDSKNELSLYLKKEISKKSLKKVSFQRNAIFIMATFYVNETKEIYNFQTTNVYRELNTELKLAFENYPIEKLIPEGIDHSKKYSLQIISKKEGNVFFDCSNRVSWETAPLIPDCKQFKQYPDQMKCLSETLKNHFTCNLNTALLPDKNTNLLSIKYNISKTGKLKSLQKSKSRTYAQEITRVFDSFNTEITPVYIDNIPINYNDHFTIVTGDNNDLTCPLSEIGDPSKRDNTYSPLSKKTDKDLRDLTQPNEENKLSLFFKEKISSRLLETTNLNKMNNNVLLYFSIDSNNNIDELSTNARSSKVNQELINIFQQYPINELNFKSSTHPLNRYIIQVLEFKNGKTIVNASTELCYERIPVYPGCGNSDSSKLGKKCFSKNVSKFVNNSFNTSIIHNLELRPGKKQIFCMFQIDKIGNICNIQIKAPHPLLKEETYNVLSKLPKMELPAIQNGKAVNVRYSFPISFMVKAPDASTSINYKNAYPRSYY